MTRVINRVQTLEFGMENSRAVSFMQDTNTLVYTTIKTQSHYLKMTIFVQLLMCVFMCDVCMGIYAWCVCVCVFSASAPTRTLGRRKLVRNRFTIDTDIVFDTDVDADADSPDSQNSLPPGDTDRWVEEQFDLQRYEETPKETDTLSDQEENEEDLQVPVSALSLEDEEDDRTEPESESSSAQHPLRLSCLGKQSAVSVTSVDEQVTSPAGEVVWVRRGDTPE